MTHKDKKRQFMRVFLANSQRVYPQEYYINKNQRIKEFWLSSFKKKKLQFSFKFLLTLFLSLRPAQSAPQCPCDQGILSLQKHADKVVMQNLKDVYRQELGTDPESNELESVASGTPQLYVFVSLSMPMSGLLDLGKQARAYGGVLVLRGLVEGSYRKTALKLKSFIEETKTGMIIDPLLFRTYRVQVVPSVVLTSGPSSPDPAAVPPPFDKTRGFITIKGALEQMEKSGDLKDNATQLLQTAATQEISK